jgi:hypothetical protein
MLGCAGFTLLSGFGGCKGEEEDGGLFGGSAEGDSTGGDGDSTGGDGDSTGGDGDSTGGDGDSTGGDGDSTGADGDSTGADSSGDGGGGLIEACSPGWDFQDCDAGWTTGKAAPQAAGAVSWACGDPNGGPGTEGGHEGQWATNLNGNYNEDESSYLESPAIDLSACPDATRVYLALEHWWQMPLGCSSDGGTIQVSDDDGMSFTTIEPSWHGYNGTIEATDSPPNGEPGFCDKTENWTTTLLDLTEFAGNPNLRIRFLFGSNGISEKEGWYIDDVHLEAYP